MRARIIVFWMLVAIPLTLDIYRQLSLAGPVDPWHPLRLALFYCYAEFIAVLLALRVFGNYNVACFILLFSLYLNTPFIVAYTGGLHSANLIFYLFLPFGVFQITKSIRISLVAVCIGFIEMLIIYSMHLSGWDFAGKRIQEDPLVHLAGNLLTATVATWFILLIYSRSLTRVYSEIAESRRFKTILSLSGRAVHEFQKPLTMISSKCASLKTGISSKENIKQDLREIDLHVGRMSSIISTIRNEQTKNEKDK